MLDRFLKTSRMSAVGESVKRDGIKATFKKYGWKLFAVVFVCYLVRDVVIYILIPIWATKSLMGP